MTPVDLPELDGSATGVAFDADGAVLWVAGSAGLHRFSIAEGRSDRVWINPAATVVPVADDESVLLGDLVVPFAIRLDRDTGAWLGDLRPDVEDPYDFAFSRGGELFDVAVSADGQQAAVTRSGPRVGVWDLPSGDLVLEVEVETGPVWDAEFSVDGTKLVTASGEGVVDVWDATTGQRRVTIERAGATDLATGPDGSLAVLSVQGLVSVLHLEREALANEARARLESLDRTWTMAECERYLRSGCQAFTDDDPVAEDSSAV